MKKSIQMELLEVVARLHEWYVDSDTAGGPWAHSLFGDDDTETWKERLDKVLQKAIDDPV